MNRKSEDMIEQILRMRQNGLKIAAIARSLQVSRNTVRGYIRKSEEVSAADDSMSATVGPEWTQDVDWKGILDSQAAGVSVKQLFLENQIPVSYGQFSRQLNSRRPKPLPSASPALRHEPGARTQIDYCDGVAITDRRSGKKRKTHFFCGVLPFSSMTFGEFVWDQKLPGFIRSHEKMWAFFGGVTPYVVIDNLKSGVTKAHRFDPDINPTYCDYGNHCGFGVLPARPRTPRDKASVESAIGAIQRDFFQAAKRETFYSLDELNTRFRQYLLDFNARKMTDYGVSRNDRFSNERPLLQELPPGPYEIFEWREARVHPDCCVQVAKGFYSVPFEYIGQVVRVKLTDKLLIIFSMCMTEIAVHTRAGDHQRSLRDEHFPNRYMQVSSYDVQKARETARRIGPHTDEYVSWQFDITRPLTALRRMQGVLRLFQSCKISPDAMEFAATQAKQFSRRDLRYFEQCAKNYEKSGSAPRVLTAPKRDLSTLHLHNNGRN